MGKANSNVSRKKRAEEAQTHWREKREKRRKLWKEGAPVDQIKKLYSPIQWAKALKEKSLGDV